ncbi:hypothetical protein ROLI_043980 [Roseobacter fucihabitans]|uniref:Exlusion protein FxsA n=1 Tax=Roseobacter fucihabitans TaxID=1537242 RepID=A0ABZ2C1Y2_9RHOB|nr:FxsA family protein [Roseobacter litoralis]MBC6963877.1 phage T7 F exclusion suppressor FxsA [Roseobacter litoralis]MBC6964038.1 phage T7 F exclusion suppressor FxsA [Roseobacter litoralis]
MWLFIAFLAVPLIEIALFIQVGGLIGLGWTLITVVFTAILGTWLVRNQGLMAINKLKSSFSDLRDPTEPLVHGAMILFSGALLLTPGFFTDAFGFLLLVPAFRTAVFKAIRARVNVQTFDTGPRQRRNQNGDIIDGEYSEVTPDVDEIKGPSKWSDH